MENTSQASLNNEEIDLIRDCALKLVRVDIDSAINLMSLAGRLRPHGKRIQEQLILMNQSRETSCQNSPSNLQICPEKKIIFVHIPKAGGTSVDNSNLFFSRKSGHSTYEYLKGVASKSDNYDWYKVFCFCRNPWDRLASAFYYLYSGGSNHGDLKDAQTHLTKFNGSFDLFLESFCHHPEKYLHLLHFRPMIYFIRPSTVSIPLFVQKLEEAADLTNLKSFLKFDLHIGHHRKRPGSTIHNLSSCYSQDTYERVKRIYAQDIKEFGYSNYSIDRLTY